MHVQKVAGALGAEISNIDLSAGVSAEKARDLRQALLDHKVIFLRNQDLTPKEFLGFALSMGEPVKYPFVRGIEGYPEIIEVKKLETETVNFGGIWHSDTTYLEIPPMGTMLLAREVPPYGGDTMFANQELAYETLSATMKKVLDGLIGVNTSDQADVSRTREDRLRTDGACHPTESYIAEHPIVRTHPETGRKSLFLNIAHTAGIKGMTDAESAPLLQFLFNHQVRPEFTCRFTWTSGAIAFWDNRSAMHNPVNDYHGFRRLMHRITLAGDRPH